MPLSRRDRASAVTIDREKLWTGELNHRALEPQTHDTVGLYDTTLRDGEQTVGVVLSPEDKLAIARALDEAGVDRIEAGFARVSEEDAEAIRLIAGAGLRAEVWGFARAVQADVEQLAGLGVSAAVIESPISDAKLAALGVSQDDMLGRIRKAVSFAAGEGITVAVLRCRRLAGRARLLPPRVRGRRRGRREGSGRRRHDRSRHARGCCLSRGAGGGLARRPGALARTRRLRPRRPLRRLLPSRPAPRGCTAR